MAERRMFAKTIIDSDAFLDMPLSTQALYFHLSMRADDEGFVNNPKKIARMIGADEDSLKLLIMKHFLIPFESGIVVIKHWRIHNYIQKDRAKPTAYQEERQTLTVKENGAYTQTDCTVRGLDTGCIQDVSKMDTQDSIGKDRLGKERIEEAALQPQKRTRFTPPTVDEVAAYCRERGNGVDAEAFVAFYESKGWKVGREPMKKWKAAIVTWEKRENKNGSSAVGKTQLTKDGEPYEILSEEGYYKILHKDGSYTLINMRSYQATRFAPSGAILDDWKCTEDELPI